MREEGDLLLWPPPANPRGVHVHVCGSGSEWGRDELLFRDHLMADSAVRWHGDRRAYTEAKTAFVLDALEHARTWATDRRWNP